MSLNEPTARSILEAAHAAWNRQDLEEMLGWYHDEITYFCNMGGSDGNALRLYGKADMRAFLEPVLRVADASRFLRPSATRMELAKPRSRSYFATERAGTC